MLCSVAVELCRGQADDLYTKFEEALHGGITEPELREIVLTSYLFDGYPAALEGYRILKNVGTSNGSTGRSIEYTSQNIEHWRQRGTKLCQQIYGQQFIPLMDRVSEFAPELRESMIGEGYGKVLSRQELNIIYRELCVVSMLTIKFRLRQLRSHILGALRVGAYVDQVEIAVSVASNFLTEEKKSKCLETQREAVARFHMP